MKAISGKQLAKLVTQKDWTLTRVHGSHHIYTKEGHNFRLSIPIHGKSR